MSTLQELFNKAKGVQETNLWDLCAAAGYTADKHDPYRPGDRAIWKDGIHEKLNNERWEKISGMSKPLEITENGRVTKFNINKKNREQNQKKLQRQILARIESGEFQSKTAKEAKTKAANWIQKNVGSQIQTEIGAITIK